MTTRQPPPQIVIRPIEASDAAALVAFHTELSSDSTRFRYFSAHPRLSDGEIERFTHVDHRGREALVALDGDEIVGVARYERLESPAEAEVAFVVADRWQHRGIGTELLAELATRAREEGVTQLVADTLFENRAMIAVFEQSGFTLRRSHDHGVVHFVMALPPDAVAGSGPREHG